MACDEIRESVDNSVRRSRPPGVLNQASLRSPHRPPILVVSRHQTHGNEACPNQRLDDTERHGVSCQSTEVRVAHCVHGVSVAQTLQSKTRAAESRQPWPMCQRPALRDFVKQGHSRFECPHQFAEASQSKILSQLPGSMCSERNRSTSVLTFLGQGFVDARDDGLVRRRVAADQ